MRQFTSISISLNHVWQGSGKLRNGHIEDCGAQFADDNEDFTEGIYLLIEDAIATGKDDLTTDIDGEGTLISWVIVNPQWRKS